ncbi:MAG: P1 family peptidase [Deltaproteobacteria bacterium]|jgi:L-aminopeptidase/D-esterase-like protein|nr:P1 family peptidase [Deltaproteobacteria bacterium]
MVPFMKYTSISEIEGFLAGHRENKEMKTGCTVILAPDGAVASAYGPGFAPGTREIELLNPKNLVSSLHALVLSGGSAFGLASATGVMRYLKEKNLGFDTGSIRVPIVSAAVIYDYPKNLSQGTLPDEDMGYAAAVAASKAPLKSGPFGAGFSAETGKISDTLSSPSGIGSSGIELAGGLKIAALAVVNAVGSVVDPRSGEIISGVRHPDGTFLSRQEILKILSGTEPEKENTNTVLIAVATNAKMDKLGAHRLARMAAAGIPRAIYPAHLLWDGDMVFALSSGTGGEFDASYLGALAAELVSQAIVNSVPPKKRA